MQVFQIIAHCKPADQSQSAFQLSHGFWALRAWMPFKEQKIAVPSAGEAKSCFSLETLLYSWGEVLMSVQKDAAGREVGPYIDLDDSRRFVTRIEEYLKEEGWL